MSQKKSSSRRWLKEHFSDPYVKQAQQQGYRSRAIYKLKELQERDRLFKQGMTVVDLGSAPGGWAQYVSSIVLPKGRVVAIDLLAMEPLKDVLFIQGDFTQEETLEHLISALEGQRVDWVLSDMAPNMSGVDSIDQPRSLYLAELALDFALKVLGPQGGFLVKTFQGEGFDEFLRLVRSHFKKVVIRKPRASRGRSSEVYILASTR